MQGSAWVAVSLGGCQSGLKATRVSLGFIAGKGTLEQVLADRTQLGDRGDLAGREMQRQRRRHCPGAPPAA